MTRILVNDYAGHPFQIELSRALAAKGYQVAHLYCETNLTPHGDLTDQADDRLTIVPISTGTTFEKYSLARRFRDEVRYGRASVDFQRQWKPDVVISSNVPLVSLNLIQSLERSTPMILWLQDIQSGLASLVLSGWKSLLHRPFAKLEQTAITRADAVVAIADSLRTEAIELGANEHNTVVIENWAPLPDLPVLPKKNAWSARHGLDENFVFLYSGTLGVKHRPELLADLAAAFADDGTVRVVVASEGIGADQLAELAEAQDLKNLVLLPFQDFEDLAPMLAAADVLTVVLEQSAGSASIPSKVLSYLCAGRPVLGSLPIDNSSTALIEKRANAGLSATDDEAFLANARLLRRDAEIRQRLGANGRRYAEQNFDIGRITAHFTEIIDSLLDHDDAQVVTGARQSAQNRNNAMLTEGGMQ